MPYLKLIKLLYIADRDAIAAYGSPITGDHYVSMDYGPVLSKTYDIIKTPPEPGYGRVGEIWNHRIARENYDVRLLNDEEPVLSQADQSLARAVYEEHKDHDQFTIAELTHDFPEWRDPAGISLPIDYEDILGALDKGKEETEDVLARLELKAFLQDFASRY